MKIILAIDETKHSQSVIDFVTNLNLETITEIWIISIIDMALNSSIENFDHCFSTTNEIETAVQQKTEQLLEQTRQKIQNIIKPREVNIFVEILKGSPEHRILEKTNVIKADLIVIGSHGYNRIKRIFLGSVSDSIIHQAPCSVLIVTHRS